MLAPYGQKSSLLCLIFGHVRSHPRSDTLARKGTFISKYKQYAFLFAHLYSMYPRIKSVELGV
jgi:hypothetical protein